MHPRHNVAQLRHVSPRGSAPFLSLALNKHSHVIIRRHHMAASHRCLMMDVFLLMCVGSFFGAVFKNSLKSWHIGNLSCCCSASENSKKWLREQELSESKVPGYHPPFPGSHGRPIWEQGGTPLPGGCARSPLGQCSPGCRRKSWWSPHPRCSPYTCQSPRSWCAPRNPASRCQVLGHCGG